MNLSNVLIAPLVTEKSNLLDKQGKYTFKVAVGANKKQIAVAVERAFKVDVVDVNTMKVKGKVKNFRGRPVKRPDWKKAIVQVADKQSISIFEGT